MGGGLCGADVPGSMLCAGNTNVNQTDFSLVSEAPNLPGDAGDLCRSNGRPLRGSNLGHLEFVLEAAKTRGQRSVWM